MGSLEELEERVSKLERQVADVRRDASAARVLAGAADRDVSEFRQTQNAHTKALNALRETQIEHHAETHARMGALEAKVEDGFAKVNVVMNHITGLLQTLIDRDPTLTGTQRERHGNHPLLRPPTSVSASIGCPCDKSRGTRRARQQA